MRILITLLIGTLLFAACKSQKEVVVAPEEEPKESNEPVRPLTGGTIEKVSAEDTLFASINKTPCYGNCPVYTMKIYSSGLVEYEGKNFTDKIGIYQTQITEEDMSIFIDSAQSIGFMEFDDIYDGPISDLPSTTTTIVIDGYRKKVYRRHGYPRSILNFEKVFQKLMESKEWVLKEQN